MQYRISYRKSFREGWQEVLVSAKELRLKKASLKGQGCLVAVHFWHERDQMWVGC